MTSRVRVRCLLVAAAALLAGPLAGSPSAIADPTPSPPASPAPKAGTGSLVAPIAVVMDVSGSMNDDDGTGRVKLDGAKEGLVTVVQDQARRGQRVGVWTYPGGDAVEGCNAGSWLAAVAQHDPVALSATINEVTADGNTPTGPALRAAADSLTRDGATRAVILLVSDGLSNCGPPPCDVAKELVQEGFDVTVEAMGFQIEDKGREELTCVAQATNGSYHDVEDTEDLQEKLRELTEPNLDLELQAPGTVTSGDVATVTATVKNPSAQSIPDVSMTMIPLNGEAGTLLPAILPPRVLLGNLPAGGSRSYSWELPLGSITKGGTATLRVTAASNGYAGAITKDVAITALSVSNGATPTTWLGKTVAPGSGSEVAIFGDSYSAGEGAGLYLSGTAGPDSNQCHRSMRTYLGQDGPVISIIACSGAVTANVTATSQNGEAPQVTNARLASVDAPVDVAFMTIGGNDIGFATILTACVMGADRPAPTPDCDESYAYKLGELSLYKAVLKDTYKRVYAAINTPDLVEARGHVAPLVILPYPNVVPVIATGSCGLDPGELKFAQRLVNGLNATIEESVGELRASTADYGGYLSYDGILFAGPVRSALGTHTMCSRDPWFHTPTIIGGALKKGAWDFSEFGHPNAAGYAAITKAIQSWAATQDLDPTTLPPSREILDGYDGNYGRIPSSVIDVMLHGGGSAIEGEPVRVSANGLAPGSTALLSVASVRYAIGTSVADADGALDAIVTVPAYVPIGAHHLVIEGLDKNLAPVTLTVPLYVSGAEPWWLSLAQIVAAVCGALGLALLLPYAPVFGRA